MLFPGESDSHGFSLNISLLGHSFLNCLSIFNFKLIFSLLFAEQLKIELVLIEIK